MTTVSNLITNDELSMDGIDKLLSECKYSKRMCERLYFIRFIKKGKNIKEASEIIGIARQTGSIWLQNYNKEGYKGLMPKFSGGRSSYLSDEQKDELRQILVDKNNNYTINEVKKLIFEKYGIKYVYKQVWTIVRKQFGLNYTKPFPYYDGRPKNGKEQLKKNTEIVDLSTDILAFLDSSAGQNLPNTTRTLHEPKTKNTITKNRKKFKVNGTGFQSVNSNSYFAITPNTRGFEFSKIFIQFRIENTNNPEAIKRLKEILNNNNLSNEYIENYFKKTRPTLKNTIEKINDNLYDDKISYDEAINKNKRYLNKLTPSTKKIEEKKKEILMELLTEKTDIKKLFEKEKTIHIVLDNYSVHYTELIKTTAKILNMNLIYLPSKSPELNPIEDVWRKIKKELSNEFIKDEEYLKNRFTELFNEFVDTPSFYENWLEEYIKC
jgi:transposase